MIAEERRAAAEVDPYAWIITRDRFNEIDPDAATAVEITGPGNAPGEMVARLEAGEGTPWRIVDDGTIDDLSEGEPGAVAEEHGDYGVMYEGLILDPSDSWPYGPQDDYARPNDGCGDIQYRNAAGEWQSL